ncbi:50S ribosomal protein L23 [Candidatus Kaiserbacteria bacterium]|nr:50S ribosomal protein L23 [Candidatus Kaiserbacteria bacterium]
MALFSKKAETKNETAVKAGTPSVSGGHDLSHILRHARITEKASQHMERSVYVFDVADRATKTEIRAAVRKLYSVIPAKVRIASVPAKTKRNSRTGKTGSTKGGKKAYVYLKKGETINL